MFCVISNKAFLQTEGHHGYAHQSFIIFYVTMCFFLSGRESQYVTMPFVSIFKDR